MLTTTLRVLIDGTACGFDESITLYSVLPWLLCVIDCAPPVRWYMHK